MISVLFCVINDIRTIISFSSGVTEVQYIFRKRYLPRKSYERYNKIKPSMNRIFFSPIHLFDMISVTNNQVCPVS